MLRQFPGPIRNLVTSLTKLPSVGPKTALRYAYAILRLSPDERARFAQAIIDLRLINFCQKCFTHSEQELCEICAKPDRDRSQVCVVAHPRDVATIEATGAYQGLYFVLGGVLNPLDGQTPETLRVRELTERAKEPGIGELILGFSPDVHGETTMLYLARNLKEANVRITRLARGLPMGADIEYADEVTLTDALAGRREA
jgi:recombination protein RecR